jgi:hypothetical protein
MEIEAFLLMSGPLSPIYTKIWYRRSAAMGRKRRQNMASRRDLG